MMYRQIIFLFLLLCCGSGTFAETKPIKDAVLTTSNRLCSIHYLSHANTTGWYIGDIDELSCASGAANGQGSVTIYNAFSKPVEQLSGYFNQGFWVGNNPFLQPLKALYLTDSDTHILTSDFGTEERLNIHYVARLSATQRADATYGPFLGCNPVQVIAVTPDSSLFEDETLQQELITSVIQRSEAVCQNVSQIYFYASNLENPENKDIFFFADINLETGDIKIRRLPKSPKNQDVLQNPSERTPLIPMPKEVRREKAIPIMAVHPIIPETKKHLPVVPQPQQPAVTLPTLTPVQSAPISAPKLLTKPQTAPANQVDLIPNLLSASRLLKQPVSGTAKIHIAHFDNKGTAIVDAPVSLRVKGSSLSLGWGLAQGDFSYTPSDSSIPDTHGFIQIHSFTPLEQETP